MVGEGLGDDVDVGVGEGEGLPGSVADGDGLAVVGEVGDGLAVAVDGSLATGPGEVGTALAEGSAVGGPAVVSCALGGGSTIPVACDGDGAGPGTKIGGNGETWRPAAGNPPPESIWSGMVQLTLPPDTPEPGA
jgi:hypothetical protein